MQLIDATLSHPVRPPDGGFAPPPAEGTLVTPLPEAQAKDTWMAKVPGPSPKGGSDDVVVKVHIRDLKRDPYISLATSPVAAFLQNVLGRPPVVEAISHETFLHTDASQGILTNMVLSAADACFQAHIPFGLRPEVLWNMVLASVAAEVKSSPDTYRHMFTTSPDQDIIMVRHDSLRLGNPYGWDQAIGMFRAPLVERVPGDLVSRCLPDFSTAGIPEGLANLVTFMDAASPFYSYEVRTRCGIPDVALFGTAEDWTVLQTRTRDLLDLFPRLAAWSTEIHVVLDKIQKTAAGEPPDLDFWNSIFKRNSMSGGDCLTGWLTVFFAFLLDKGGNLVPRTNFKWDHGAWGGINPAGFPGSMSVVDFVWDYFGTRLDMQFLGGTLTTEDIGGFLTPRLGWAVAHK